MEKTREILSATETMQSLYDEANRIAANSKDYMLDSVNDSFLRMEKNGHLSFVQGTEMISAPMSRFAADSTLWHS